MDLKEYQNSAFRTCADKGSLQANLCHMVLGIVSENEEYLKAIVENDLVNAKEEQADQCWYIANYCTYRNFDFEEICENMYDALDELENWEQETSLYDVYVSKLADQVKKYMAYDKPLDVNIEKKALKAIILSLTFEDTGFDLNIDLQKNIDKLKQRYPEKFTTENALNRDLEAERKILEA